MYELALGLAIGILIGQVVTVRRLRLAVIQVLIWQKQWQVTRAERKLVALRRELLNAMNTPAVQILRWTTRN